MLKIKEGIDLKELEKFGFKRMKNHFYKCKRSSYSKSLKNGYIEIDSNTRWISQDGNNFFREDEIVYQNTLYDLIKDDLVEKVKEQSMNINDYVRTKKGIAKIIGKNDDVRYHYPNAWETDTYLEINDDTEYVYEEDVIKSSPNIIDLIEVGDYVNGLKVSSVDGTYYGRKDKAIYCDYCEDKETGEWAMIYDDEIKSIVTKEQFESMEYKVKE